MEKDPMRKSIVRDLSAYLLWAVVLALGIWLLLLSRNAVLAVFSALSTNTTTTGAGQLETLDKFYSIAAGILWLALMIVSELYFRSGARRGVLLPSFARVIGAELLLLFVVDTVLLVIIGFAAATLWRWLILTAEISLAIVCLRFARSAPSIWSVIRRGEEA